MTWMHNGGDDLATEFDPTTARVLNTIRSVGTTEEQITDDMMFVATLVDQVKRKTLPGEPVNVFIPAMDCLFLGLLYHRHMPFYDHGGVLLNMNEQRLPNDYIFTLNNLSMALIHQMGVKPEDVASDAQDAATLVSKMIREDRFEVLELVRDCFALGIIGMLVHRRIPSTPNKPI